MVGADESERWAAIVFEVEGRSCRVSGVELVGDSSNFGFDCGVQVQICGREYCRWVQVQIRGRE